VLCSLLWVTLLGQGVGLGDSQRALPTPAMLGLRYPKGRSQLQGTKADSQFPTKGRKIPPFQRFSPKTAPGQDLGRSRAPQQSLRRPPARVPAPPCSHTPRHRSLPNTSGVL